MPIKLKPSYQASDGKCYATYEEAQKAEIMALFNQSEWIGTKEGIACFLLQNGAELTDILKPKTGRPVGSKSKVRKSKTPEPPANETGDP